MNPHDIFGSEAFDACLRHYIDESVQLEAQRWRALMTGGRPSYRQPIPLPVRDVLDEEIVLDDILDADHIG